MGKPGGQFRTPPGVAAFPVRPELVQGDPWALSRWDGSKVELAGPAAMTGTELAVDPCVRWLDHGDCDDRLRANDLVLIAQRADHDAVVVVVTTGESPILARPGKDGLGRIMETGKPILQGRRVAGHCVA